MRFRELFLNEFGYKETPLFTNSSNEFEEELRNVYSQISRIVDLRVKDNNLKFVVILLNGKKDTKFITFDKSKDAQIAYRKIDKNIDMINDRLQGIS